MKPRYTLDGQNNWLSTPGYQNAPRVSGPLERMRPAGELSLFEGALLLAGLCVLVTLAIVAFGGGQ